MEIQNYRASELGEWWVAKFDVFFRELDLLFRDYKLCKSKTGHYFISPPAFGVEQPDGKKKYIPYMEFVGAAKAPFNKGILESVMSFSKIKGEPLPPEPEQLTFF